MNVFFARTQSVATQALQQIVVANGASYTMDLTVRLPTDMPTTSPPLASVVPAVATVPTYVYIPVRTDQHRHHSPRPFFHRHRR